MNHTSYLRPEDYMEPACLLCSGPYGRIPEVQPVPVQQILDKLDSHMRRRDYPAAERHLLYWMDEAVRGKDLGGQLMLSNELIGFYRKTGRRDEAFACAEKALSLLQNPDLEKSLSAGTTFINVATAYSAFNEPGTALEFFKKAEAVYESFHDVPAHLLGGLYNNMAQACHSLGHYADAFVLYDKAMKSMETVPGGVLEQAITCLNMADTVAAEQGMEEGEARIFELLDRAYDYLMDESAPRDGYYAFVCEKCAPGFAYFGFFAAAEELRKAAKEIYERT